MKERWIIMLLDNNSYTREAKNTMFISIKEACAITGIGRNTLLKFTKIKGFPAIIIPREDFYRQRRSS